MYVKRRYVDEFDDPFMTGNDGKHERSFSAEADARLEPWKTSLGKDLQDDDVANFVWVNNVLKQARCNARTDAQESGVNGMRKEAGNEVYGIMYMSHEIELPEEAQFKFTIADGVENQMDYYVGQSIMRAYNRADEFGFFKDGSSYVPMNSPEKFGRFYHSPTGEGSHNLASFNPGFERDTRGFTDEGEILESQSKVDPIAFQLLSYARCYSESTLVKQVLRWSDLGPRVYPMDWEWDRYEVIRGSRVRNGCYYEQKNEGFCLKRWRVYFRQRVKFYIVRVWGIHSPSMLLPEHFYSVAKGLHDFLVELLGFLGIKMYRVLKAGDVDEIGSLENVFPQNKDYMKYDYIYDVKPGLVRRLRKKRISSLAYHATQVQIPDLSLISKNLDVNWMKTHKIENEGYKDQYVSYYAMDDGQSWTYLDATSQSWKGEVKYDRKDGEKHEWENSTSKSKTFWKEYQTSWKVNWKEDHTSWKGNWKKDQASWKSPQGKWKWENKKGSKSMTRTWMFSWM